MSKVSPDMMDYLGSFSPYGQKTTFRGRNTDRLTEFVKGNKLDEFPDIARIKKLCRKALKDFTADMGIFFMGLFGVFIVLILTATLLNPK